jgi:plastocyanin
LSAISAIRLKSDDDFVATQRIYAVAANGSLGQFVGGVDATSAKTKGVIIQLAAGSSFRTNVGAANPNATAATVTWHLYDKNNAVVGAPFDLTVTQDAAPIERTLTIDVQGTYVYYCTITTCSPGHLNMQGSFVVGKASQDPPGY